MKIKQEIERQEEANKGVWLDVQAELSKFQDIWETDEPYQEPSKEDIAEFEKLDRELF